MKFTALSESEISKIAEVQVWKGSYYDQTRKPIEGGLLDPRMVLCPNLDLLRVYLGVYVGSLLII